MSARDEDETNEMKWFPRGEFVAWGGDARGRRTRRARRARRGEGEEEEEEARGGGRTGPDMSSAVLARRVRRESDDARGEREASPRSTRGSAFTGAFVFAFDVAFQSTSGKGNSNREVAFNDEVFGFKKPNTDTQRAFGRISAPSTAPSSGALRTAARTMRALLSIHGVAAGAGTDAACASASRKRSERAATCADRAARSGGASARGLREQQRSSPLVLASGGSSRGVVASSATSSSSSSSSSRALGRARPSRSGGAVAAAAAAAEDGAATGKEPEDAASSSHPETSDGDGGDDGAGGGGDDEPPINGGWGDFDGGPEWDGEDDEEYVGVDEVRPSRSRDRRRADRRSDSSRSILRARCLARRPKKQFFPLRDLCPPRAPHPPPSPLNKP